MVLSKQEVISSLQGEIRILMHLISKIEKAKLDYRPTAKQRSLLELVRYMVIMGLVMIASSKAVYSRRGILWRGAVAGALQDA
jgi:hypothetical protein